MLRVYSGANENAPLLESMVESLRLVTRLGYVASSNVFIYLGERCD